MLNAEWDLSLLDEIKSGMGRRQSFHDHRRASGSLKASEKNKIFVYVYYDDIPADISHLTTTAGS